MSSARLLVLGCAQLLVCMSLAGRTIVVESRPEGQNFDHYQELLGKWTTSQTPPAQAKSQAPGLTDCQKCGSRKVLFYHEKLKATDTTAPAAARFSPKLDKPGHYSVFATWSSASNATPAYYVIRYANGVTTKTLAQDGRGFKGEANANRWVPLGEFDFAAGDDQYVELRIEMNAKPVDRRAFGQVYSDAVMFTQEPADSAAAKPAPTTSLTSTSPSAPAPAAATPAAPLASATPAPSASPDPVWLTEIRQGMTMASQTQRRILVYFYSPQSTMCQYLEREVFSNPEIKTLLNNSYVLVRLDMPAKSQIAAQLKVFKAGTLCLYDSKGGSLGQITERLSATELLAKLR